MMRDQHIVLIDIELKGKGVEVTTRSAGELTVRVGGESACQCVAETIFCTLPSLFEPSIIVHGIQLVSFDVSSLYELSSCDFKNKKY